MAASGATATMAAMLLRGGAPGISNKGASLLPSILSVS